MARHLLIPISKWPQTDDDVDMDPEKQTASDGNESLDSRNVELVSANIVNAGRRKAMARWKRLQSSGSTRGRDFESDPDKDAVGQRSPSPDTPPDPKAWRGQNLYDNLAADYDRTRDPESWALPTPEEPPTRHRELEHVKEPTKLEIAVETVSRLAYYKAYHAEMKRYVNETLSKVSTDTDADGEHAPDTWRHPSRSTGKPYCADVASDVDMGDEEEEEGKVGKQEGELREKASEFGEKEGEAVEKGGNVPRSRKDLPRGIWVDRSRDPRLRS